MHDASEFAFQPKRIVVAGASGFVGKRLIKVLSNRFPHTEIIAVSRSAPRTTVDDKKIVWKRADFFSLIDCEKALEGSDVAFYLVHSMLPSARLDQGDFSDHDLILADNFSRACKTKGIKQIIYLGGLIPQGGDLSKHLQSRQEVEHSLATFKTPLTSLRAGLVIGRGCSSFTIVERLVTRLPFMVCPKWTRTRCQPIDVQDVLENLVFVVGRESCLGKSFDIGGPSILSYKTILMQTADVMGRPRLLIEAPLLTPRLSRMWVSLVTGAPRDLVYPLIESLRHDMTVNADRWLRIPGRTYKSFRKSLTEAMQTEPIEQNERKATSVPKAFHIDPSLRRQKRVRSVQRLILPKGLRSQDIAKLYTQWLPSFLPLLIRVETPGTRCRFFLSKTKILLLDLEHSIERSSLSRQLFYIRGGVLVKTIGRGRLEFREVLGGKFILAAVHDFQPLLPWYLYRFTQAQAHILVMHSFGRHLQKLDREIPAVIDAT